MINLDLSKALHPRALASLTAMMPGIFFEICIAVGNPQLLDNLIAQARLDRSTTIVIALILAFIIGNAFCCWVALIQRVFYRAQRAGFWCWSRFMRFLFTGYPGQSGWKVAIKTRAVRSTFWNRLNLRTLDSGDFRKTVKAWRRVAERILRLYGIEDVDFFRGEDWGIWAPALAPFRAADLRGQLLTIAMHATGWSGLVAVHYVPKLHTAYFLTFCEFLIAVGLMHDWWVAKRLSSPSISWQVGLQRTIEELKDVLERSGQLTKATEQSNEG